MPKWKLQRITPDTCDPIEVVQNWTDPIEGPKSSSIWVPCIYWELYDVLLPGGSKVFSIAAVENVCIAHAVGTTAAKGKLLWQDGNWKDFSQYLKYQQDWFRWLVVEEFKAKKEAGIIPADKPLPDSLMDVRGEPVTPGSVSIPDAQEITDLQQIYTWNRNHNAWAGDSQLIMQSTVTDLDMSLVTWWFVGTGDSRVLHVSSGGQLTNPEINSIQAAADLQFGSGNVVIED